MDGDRPEPRVVAECDQIRATLVGMGGVFGAYLASLQQGGFSREEALSMVLSAQAAWLTEFFDPMDGDG